MINAMTRIGLLFALALPLLGQAPGSPVAQPVISPEVHPDGRVTFRFRAPNAKEVTVSFEGAQRLPMKREESGVWVATSDVLPPDIYAYSFIADGVRYLDPRNPLIKPNLLNPSSMVVISGGDQPWEVRDVPRGAIHRHFYHSAIVGDDRDYYVYTPPGYDSTAKKLYPTLYLLHGYSDDASGWTAVGRAHVILDNLIAQGKAHPMIVVMPLGYGAPEVVSNTFPLRDSQVWQRNFDRFRDALLQELMPRIEKEYRVHRNRSHRAIAGLSMGGSESLYVGLNALDRFSAIGAFSSGGLRDDLASLFPKLTEKTRAQLQLLWISCGVDDRLIDANRKLVEFLNSKKISVKLKEVPGAHTWQVWRRNLAEFASLLFQKKTSPASD
jgi:enterochelin esterase family protein